MPLAKRSTMSGNNDFCLAAGNNFESNETVKLRNSKSFVDHSNTIMTMPMTNIPRARLSIHEHGYRESAIGDYLNSNRRLSLADITAPPFEPRGISSGSEQISSMPFTANSMQHCNSVSDLRVRPDTFGHDLSKETFEDSLTTDKIWPHWLRVLLIVIALLLICTVVACIALATIKSPLKPYGYNNSSVPTSVNQTTG